MTQPVITGYQGGQCLEEAVPWEPNYRLGRNMQAWGHAKGLEPGSLSTNGQVTPARPQTSLHRRGWGGDKAGPSQVDGQRAGPSQVDSQAGPSRRDGGGAGHRPGQGRAELCLRRWGRFILCIWSLVWFGSVPCYARGPSEPQLPIQQGREGSVFPWPGASRQQNFSAGKLPGLKSTGTSGPLPSWYLVT